MARSRIFAYPWPFLWTNTNNRHFNCFASAYPQRHAMDIQILSCRSMRLHTPSVSALAYFPLSPPKVSYVRIASLLSCRKRVMALALDHTNCGCINGLVIFCIHFSFPTPWHDKDSDPSDSFLTPSLCNTYHHGTHTSRWERRPSLPTASSLSAGGILLSSFGYASSSGMCA